MESNVTSDIDLAREYSYNFETGEYEDLVVFIRNIPLEAFIAYRDDEYEDDDDFILMDTLTENQKIDQIEYNTLFLVNLFPYKNQIITELISE